MKQILIAALLTILYSNILAQNDTLGSEGFVQNVIVPDFLGRNVNRYYAYDNSGALISQPFLFSDLDFSSYELISANLSFSDKNSTQKVVFSPLKLIQKDLNKLEIIRSAKLNFAQKDGISTLGFSLSGDNSSPFSKQSKKNAQKIKYPAAPQIPDSTDFASFSKVLADYKRQLNKVIIDFDKARLKNVWKYSVGYNVQLFSIFGAKGSTDDFDSLNTYSIKSKTISGSLTYSREAGSFEVTGNYNYIKSRKGASDGNNLQPYSGPSISIKKRLIQLTSDDHLASNNDYIKSHFIPSIDLGVSFEGKYYEGDDNAQAEDGIKTLEVVTVFFDFKISPSAQFRIGLPRTWTNKIDDSNESGFGAILQYSFKIVNLE